MSQQQVTDSSISTEGITSAGKVGTPGKGGSGSGYTSETRVSTMSDLKTKAPEVLEAMKEGIAMQIITQLRRRTERLRKIMREYRR